MNNLYKYSCVTNILSKLHVYGTNCMRKGHVF